VRAPARRVGAVLGLVVRDRWGQIRERGPWSLAVLLLVAVGLAGVFVPLGLAGGSALATWRGDARYAGVIQLLVTTIFVTWVASGLIIGARYTLQIDLSRLIRLPLGFRTAWSIRVGASLWGGWLVLFAPVLMGLAWMASSSWVGMLWRTALIVEFAWLTSELTVALRWRYAWLASRRRSLLLTIVLGWVIVVPLMVVVMRGPSEAARIATRAVELVSPVVAQPTWLPPGALARALAEPGLRSLALATVALSAGFAAVLVFSYRTFRRAILITPGRQTVVQRAATPWIAFLTRARGWLSPALRVYVAMAVLETLSLARISNLRMFAGFAVPYFVVFPWLLPLDSYGVIATDILLALVFLYCSGLKTNLLGIDATTVRQYLIWPVSVAAVVRVRLAVVNLAVLVFSVEAVSIVALRGGFDSLSDLVLVASAFASLLLATDASGGRWSLRAPVPVTWGRAFPAANDAGGFGMLAVVLLLTLVSTGLAVAMDRPPLAPAALVVAVLLPVGLAFWTWRRFWRWSVPALSLGRERLLSRLRA